MDESTVEPSRSSSLNRTMVLSKRANRPGLPKLDGDDLCISEPIAAPANLEAQRVHYRSGADFGRRNHVRSATVTISSETMEEFQRAFDEIQDTTMSDAEKLIEVRRRILSLVDAKEKQWNAQNQTVNENDSSPGKSSVAKLETDIARKAALYADRFFKICERNEIDIEKVLKNDPDMIFSMKLRSVLPTPSTAADQTKEIEELRKERDNLCDETKGLKASYANLFKSYDKLRTNYELLQESRNSLVEKSEMQRNAMNSMYESALNLKSIMAEQAAMADQTIAETKGRYDSNTVTIRMNLVRLENENSSLKSEIDTKTKEIEELRMIIHEVVKQVTLVSSDGV
ncbi:hypothetical protein M3Y94_00845100 [Aphelenchoides besseyi]|nr:hypothetical protein M3Y94_00845100 [Aphelenchoides besseyi]KAI6226886.1 Transforming acidic coiled-coil-containing protein 3 [Aphelenchoides besseyi]